MNKKRLSIALGTLLMISGCSNNNNPSSENSSASSNSSDGSSSSAASSQSTVLTVIELVPVTDAAVVNEETEIAIQPDQAGTVLAAGDFSLSGGNVVVENGKAKFTVDQAGTYTISATKDGVTSNTVTIRVVAVDDPEAEAIRTASNEAHEQAAQEEQNSQAAADQQGGQSSGSDQGSEGSSADGSSNGSAAENISENYTPVDQIPSDQSGAVVSDPNTAGYDVYYEPSAPASSLPSQGTFQFTVNDVIIRTGMDGLESPESGYVYNAGMQVYYDGVYQKDGYTWLTYLSYGGVRQSVPVGNLENILYGFAVN